MKQHITVLSLIVIFFLQNTLVLADEPSMNHIESLQLKIIEMETQLTAMRQSKDPWELRSGMKDHANMMKESAELVVELAEAKNKEYKSCTKKNTPSFGECDQAEYRLLAILIAHIVNRQNIILERTGIIHNRKKTTEKK